LRAALLPPLSAHTNSWRLGIAQPPLILQIKRLEEHLGHRLFDRTTRGVKLTLAGQLLAERARSTIDKVQDD
jgi:DNA-binding transcriptional LysR family regulator